MCPTGPIVTVSSASIPVRVSTKDNLESASMSNKDLKPKQDVRENKKQPAKPKGMRASSIYSKKICCPYLLLATGKI